LIDPKRAPPAPPPPIDAPEAPPVSEEPEKPKVVIKPKPKPKPEPEQKSKQEEVPEIKAHFALGYERITDLSMSSLGIKNEEELKNTVIAFDLDYTLKYGSLKEFDEQKNMKIPKRKLRGGAETEEMLRKCQAAGAILLVLTAREPSQLKHDACRIELEALDVYKYFKDDTKPQQFVVDENVKLFGGAGILVCSYYKPHSLLAFLEAANKKPKRIVFVDDFVVNVASFGDHLGRNAQNKMLSDCVSVDCYWLDPKPLVDIGEMAISKSENSYDKSYAPYLELILKNKKGQSKEQVKA